jgi:hypothetical protein
MHVLRRDCSRTGNSPSFEGGGREIPRLAADRGPEKGTVGAPDLRRGRGPPPYHHRCHWAVDAGKHSVCGRMRKRASAFNRQCGDTSGGYSSQRCLKRTGGIVCACPAPDPAT